MTLEEIGRLLCQLPVGYYVQHGTDGTWVIGTIYDWPHHAAKTTQEVMEKFADELASMPPRVANPEDWLNQKGEQENGNAL
jgi:hypothetical protein